MTWPIVLLLAAVSLLALAFGVAIGIMLGLAVVDFLAGAWRGRRVLR